MNPLNRVLLKPYCVAVWCIALLGVALVGNVIAKEAVPMSDDPVMEKRVNEISAELRCLVCQNQTIADSNAELAVDLKNQVRDMVKAGKSQQDIVDYMVTRYGDFVLYRPPVKPETYILWAGPFILMIVGIVLLIINLKKRRELIEDKPISDDEAGKLNNILKDQGMTVESISHTKAATAPSADEGKAS